MVITTLNTELNPICHLLALLAAQQILHVSRVRVKNSLVTSNINLEQKLALCSEILWFIVQEFNV
jgi:hypothetical protein